MSQSVADKLLLSANEESLAVSNFHPVIMGIHLVRGKPQLVFHSQMPLICSVAVVEIV